MAIGLDTARAELVAIQDMKDELKPCPFCGSSEAREVDFTLDDPWFAIQCYRNGKVGCGASTGSSTSFADARIAWNTRSTK